MADNQKNTRGGSSEQHAKAGSQSHKNQSGNQDDSQGSNMRGGTSEQHAEAGRKGGEAKAQNNQGGSSSGNMGGNQGGNNGGRGFAGMDEDQQREIASKGGKAAHESGNANEFDSDEAREAGRKGGSR